MAQPPTTSLASAYGPSTRLTSPWRTTKFTASSVPYRPPPSRNTPLAARSPMWASIASNSACGGVPTPSSILTNPMKRGILTTPTGCWGVASRTYVERMRGPSTSTSEVSSILQSARLPRRPDTLGARIWLGVDDQVAGGGGAAQQDLALCDLAGSDAAGVVHLDRAGQEAGFAGTADPFGAGRLQAEPCL